MRSRRLAKALQVKSPSYANQNYSNTRNTLYKTLAEPVLFPAIELRHCSIMDCCHISTQQTLCGAIVLRVEYLLTRSADSFTNQELTLVGPQENSKGSLNSALLLARGTEYLILERDVTSALSLRLAQFGRACQGFVYSTIQGALSETSSVRR